MCRGCHLVIFVSSLLCADDHCAGAALGPEDFWVLIRILILMLESLAVIGFYFRIHATENGELLCGSALVPPFKFVCNFALELQSNETVLIGGVQHAGACCSQIFDVKTIHVLYFLQLIISQSSLL
jgi:hypothetical protein